MPVNMDVEIYVSWDLNVPKHVAYTTMEKVERRHVESGYSFSQSLMKMVLRVAQAR